MTLEFDRKARENLRCQKRLFDITKFDNTKKVSDMKIKSLKTNIAREYIATHHYSHLLPDCITECYAGYYGNRLAGVIIFGRGANNNTFSAIIKDIKLNECRELTRLWSPDGMPKNTESKLISMAIKKLPKEVKMIVSFADPFQNHIGTIYQATNFYYIGMSNPSKMLIDKKGNLFHVRTIGSYKRRHPELKEKTNLEVMEKYGWKYCDSSGKYRYVIFKGNKLKKTKLLKEIKNRILPYPKMRFSVKAGKPSAFQVEDAGSNPTNRNIKNSEASL